MTNSNKQEKNDLIMFQYKFENQMNLTAIY